MSWAPIIIDEENEDEEHELIVAVSRRESAEVYSVNTIIRNYGSQCSVTDIEEGLKRIENGHTKVGA